MMVSVPLIEIDDSLGFILPDEVIQRLGVKEGDDIRMLEHENGYSLEPVK